MTTIRRVRCPTCGASVEWTPAAKHRPFCSERCRQIDLGAWASEAYRVAARPSDTEEDPPGTAFDQARQIP